MDLADAFLKGMWAGALLWASVGALIGVAIGYWAKGKYLAIVSKDKKKAK